MSQSVLRLTASFIVVSNHFQDDCLHLLDTNTNVVQVVSCRLSAINFKVLSAKNSESKKRGARPPDATAVL